MTRVLLTSHLWFAALIWVAILAVSALVTTGIAIWGHVDRSVWHYPAAQLTRWFAIALGIDAINTYLRLHLAHGRTRRDFLRQLWPYLACLAVGLALLVVLGFLLERGVYALAGWPHHTVFPTSFGSTGNVLGMVGAFTLMLLLWTVAGALFATAFTRNFLLGLLTIPFVLVIVSPSDHLVGTFGVPVIQEVVSALDLPPLTGIVTSLVWVVAGCAAVWGIARDMPLRPRVA
jgi:hypothetical protein